MSRLVGNSDNTVLNCISFPNGKITEKGKGKYGPTSDYSRCTNLYGSIICFSRFKLCKLWPTLWNIIFSSCWHENCNLWYYTYTFSIVIIKLIIKCWLDLIQSKISHCHSLRKQKVPIQIGTGEGWMVMQYIISLETKHIVSVYELLWTRNIKWVCCMENN